MGRRKKSSEVVGFVKAVYGKRTGDRKARREGERELRRYGIRLVFDEEESQDGRAQQ